MDNTYTEMFYDCIINKLDNKYFKYYPSIVDKIYYNEFYNYTDKDYGVIENRFSLFGISTGPINSLLSPLASCNFTW